MTPAAILARCLEQQAAADSRAALDYATGCSVGTVLALFAAGLLSADECDAGTAAARDADSARRLAWNAARVAAPGACSWPATARHASPADLLAARMQRINLANEGYSVTFAYGAAEGAAGALEDAGLISSGAYLEYVAQAEGAAEERRHALESAAAVVFCLADPAPEQPSPAAPPATADAGDYIVTGEADESGERLYVAGPFASYAEADELAAALQEDAEQWEIDDPLLCTSRVRYRVELLADLPPVEPDEYQQDAAPTDDPQAWGFLGLAYCLADCLGDSAASPPTPAERSMLRGMAASAMRAWQAVHAAHGEELASLHAATRHAGEVGAHSVGAVSVELLQLLIGEGVRHD